MPGANPRPHPAADSRYKMLDVAMRKYGHDSEALIEVLHTAQELFGYLPKELLRYVSERLDVPLSKTYGVATFYNFFSLAPKGAHSCVVCLGTACYVKRAAEVVSALEQAFGIHAEQITPDGQLSLSVARCVGSCGLAPVVLLDGQVKGKGTPESIVQMVREVLAGSAAAPTSASTSTSAAAGGAS